MEGEESPLEVLSRAATMVSPPPYDISTRTYSSKEMPCAKWRRERRQVINNKIIDGPLDFSTRHLNMKPPPSYDQSIQSKMLRPSVIQPVSAIVPLAPSDGDDAASKSTPSGNVCDPAIDEHFRRSLGKDYSSIFASDNNHLNSSFNCESHSAGLTVDDHFAKALGDTWLKLKKKENEEKIRLEHISNNNHLTLQVKNLSSEQCKINIKKKKKNKGEIEILSEKKNVSVRSGWVKT